MLNQQKELKTINVEREQKEVLLAEFKQNESKIAAEIRQKQVESKSLKARSEELSTRNSLLKAKSRGGKKSGRREKTFSQNRG